jgi:hypothetical protein
MLGIIGILSSAKRLLGIVLGIKNNAISVESSLGVFTGVSNTITPSAWNHIAMSVSANVATLYVNGSNTGGSYGSVPAFTPPSQALLYNVNYLKDTCININANTFLNANNKVFVDKSPLASLVTNTSGNQTASGVTLGSVSPYSNLEWSAEFNNAIISAAKVSDQIYLSRDDFTIEFWVYVKETGVAQVLLDFRGAASSANVHLVLDTTLKPYLFVDNAKQFTSTTSLVINTWYHIALSRNSEKNNGTLYINGISVGSWIPTTVPKNYFDNSGNIVIGKSGTDGTAPLKGFISNLRIIKGVSLYNSNFTPPTQSLKILDSSNKMWSRFFDGTTTGVLSDISYDGYIGNDNFSFDCWIYSRSAVGQNIIDTRTPSSTTSNFYIYINPSQYIELYIHNSLRLTSTLKVSQDIWNHLRVERIGTRFYLYINGVLDGSTAALTEIFYINFNNIAIGSDYNGGTRFVGYISNMRLLRGATLINTSISLPVSTFGYAGLSASNYAAFFNENGYLSSGSSSYILGDNDFTIECWFNANKYTTNPRIFELNTTVADNLLCYFDTTTNIINYNIGGTNIMSSIMLPATGEWHHIALSRSKSNGITCYLDGVSAGYANDTSITYAGDTLTIGSNRLRTGNYFNGYISNFRIINGTALYTGSAINIPSTNLSNITNTVFLTLQDKTLIDNSSTSKSIVASNITTPLIPINFYKNKYDKSIIFSGTNYLSTNSLDSNIFNFGNKDFTVEFWLYQKTISDATQYHFDSRNLASGNLYVYRDTIYYNIIAATDNASRGFKKCNHNKWTHVAYVREFGKNSSALYVDGKRFSDKDFNDLFKTFTFTKNLVIGASYDSLNKTFANISDLRVVNGTAMYKSEFTPPTAALTITPTIGEERYSGKFINSGRLSAVITPNTLNFGINDFTIEFWVLFDNVGSQVTLFDSRPNAAAIVPLLSRNSTNNIVYNVNNTDQITHATAVVANRWYHVAVVRKYGLGTRLFLNGLSGGSLYTGDIASSYADVTNLVVGANYNSTNIFGGNISNLRVVNGTALYTSNFTPNSSTLLTNITNTKLLTLQSNTLLDNSSTFTGSNSLSALGGFYISYENPYNIYATSKTTLLTLQNGSLIDKVHNTNLFNASVGINNYSHTGPYEELQTSTMLLMHSNSPLSGDLSGHISLSARNNTYSVSSVGPFGSNGYSGVFNGTSTNLSGVYSGPTLLNDEPFTIEFSFYKNNIGTALLFSTTPFNSSTGGFVISTNSGNQILVRKPADGSTAYSFYGPIIDINTWYHVVLTRDHDNVIYFYVNGELYGSLPSFKESLVVHKNINIGSWYVSNAYTEFFNGLISNFRIIKGSSKYNDVKFELPTTATDDINYNSTTTSYSYYFPELAANTLHSVNPKLVFGKSSFTVEFWVKFSKIGAASSLIETRWGNSDPNGWWINLLASNQIQFGHGGTARITSLDMCDINSWYHIVWTRDANIGSKLYINGKIQGSYNDTAISYTNYILRIGAAYNNTQLFKGYISNLRIVKNSVVYTGDSFVVPTQPLSLNPTTLNNEYAIKFDQARFRGLLYNKAIAFGTGSFCIEFYVAFADTGRLCYIYDTFCDNTFSVSNFTNNFLRIRRNASNYIECLIGNTIRITSSVVCSNASKWYHIAYNRIAGDRSILYIDGLSAGAYADSAISYDTTQTLNLGFTNYPYEMLNTLLNGYMSNIRISNISVYPSAFSVPDTLSLSASTVFLSLKDNTLKDLKVPTLTGYYYLDGKYEGTTTFGTYNLTAVSTPYTVIHTLDNTNDHFYKKDAIYDDKTTPFGESQETIFNFLKEKGDTEGVMGDFFPKNYSKQNPFDSLIYTTTLLALQDNRYNDTSIYKSVLLSPLSAPAFSNFSPFLNITPFSASNNGGSIYFGPAAGTKFLLVSSANAIANLSSGDFTVEMWVYPTPATSPTPSSMVLFDAVTGSTPQGMQIYIDQSNDVVFLAQGKNRIISIDPIQNYAWSHIAVSKYKNNICLFVNGRIQGSSSDTFNYTLTEKLMIGSRLSAINTNSLSGYITDVHLVSGKALYRSEFTPPVEPLSSFYNSCLLINANNGGVIDSTGKFNLYTGGSVKISNDVPTISSSASTGTLSAGSIYFDGSNNSYIFTDTNNTYFDLSGAYTIEFWLKPTLVPTASAVLFSVRNSDTDKIVLAINNNRNLIYRSTSATVISSFTSTAQVTANTWQHVALVRNLSSGTTYKTTLYINGADMGFTSAANSGTPKVLHIGSDNNTNRLSGYIDDFRVIKNTTRYLAPFNKPEREGEIHNNLAYPDDPYLNNTVLLLNADSNTAAQNTSYVDESNLQSTITVAGNPIQGSISPFSPGFGYNPKKHAGSVYLDGQSDIFINDSKNYLKKPFLFGNDYTVEAWVYPLNSGDLPTIFDTRKSGISSRVGSTFNGLKKFKGYITGVKTTKGVSLYKSSFTLNLVPSTIDDNTTLLLNFNKLGVYDTLSKNNISTIDNVSISYDIKKYGIGSIGFNGGYLAMPSSSNFILGADNFTFDWNMYLTNTTSGGIFSTAIGSSINGNFYIAIKNGKLCVGVYGGQEIIFTSWSPDSGVWYHLALVRDTGNCTLYVNGSSVGTYSFTNDLSIQNGGYIGNNNGDLLIGYIDEFRLTKNVARYTSNFNSDQSMSLLYDAAGNGYTLDTSSIVLDPPRYPDSPYDYDTEYICNCSIWAGGGGGGAGNFTSKTPQGCGGGGAGGLKHGSFTIKNGMLIAVKIGAGGAGVSAGTTPGNGSTSLLSSINFTISALGGGCGAFFTATTQYDPAPGGSGGGGSLYKGAAQGTLNQGFSGGGWGYSYISNGTTAAGGVGGGGGGSGSPGTGAKFKCLSAHYTGNSIPYNDVDYYNNRMEHDGGVGTYLNYPKYILVNSIGFSGVCGGGSGGTGFDALRVSTVYITKRISPWGGGGSLYLWNNTPGQESYLKGWHAAPYTGGGGGGSYSIDDVNSVVYSGSGGGGGAVLEMPIALKNMVWTTGTVDKYATREKLYLIFKSSGTINII